jgi:Fur family peroxide stress response transcriptional regulator
MEKAYLVRLLKDKELQVTPQRLAIFERLVDRKDHPSAEMIYSELSHEFPSLTLVTVYNTLQKLEASGLCCKVNPLHSAARYDGTLDAHMHLICSNCEQVLDLHNVPFSVEVPHGMADGFEVRSHSVNLFGVCKECQKRVMVGSGDNKKHKKMQPA